jgi:mannosyl-glycoprotein endo-beta-N-acetylglucosaminidase
MPIRSFLLLTILAAGAAAGLPGQPYASYWFPNELLAWSPGGDPDAPYNRGTIELADRSLGDTQANPHARPGEARIAALSIMYPSTSGNPSQGGLGFDVYAFGYWQYCDRLVMWGGSAGEGLILAPSADVIDAGHRNGVPVYGTVFFPPAAYGGQIQWVLDFVQKSGGTFPVADKLIEVAEYYGFDGWFINQETAGGSSGLAQAMRDLMVYVHETSDIRIMWYDAMVEGGGIAWQNALNVNNDLFFQDGGTLVSDEMFLNFWWSTNGLALSAAYAENLGRSPYDLNAGADVQANGYNTSVNWAGLFPEGSEHVTSLGFYCPNWTYTNSTGPEDFYTRDNRFWVGANRDPSNTETTHPWKGMAHYVPATTSITSLPFVTTFCAGQGNLYAREGEVVGAFSWNNRSLQDVLPTWRWIVDSPGTPLYPDIDFSTAYWGGSCVSVEGTLSPGSPITMYLYKTDLTLSAGDRLVLAYDAGSAGDPSCIEVGLAFEDPESLTWLDVGTQTGEGWNDWESDLSAHSGRTLSVIAFRFDAPAAIPDYTARLGMLGILQGDPDIPSPPSGLWVEGFLQVDDTHGTVRLRWNASPDPTALYLVSRVNADESRTWLGSCLGEACFVPELVREGMEDSTTIEVTAVGIEYGVSDPVSITVGWTTTGITPGTGRFSLALSGWLPNPLRGPAAVAYTLPASGPASLSVYGLDGRLAAVLAEGELQAGTHQVAWDPSTLPNGVYFLRLSAGGVAVTERCVILR